MPPVITNVSPDEGLSVGETCVTITGTGFALPSAGGSVRVLFNGIEAIDGGPVDDTTILALTPPGILGAIDVTVENTIPGPIVESDVLAGGFTYKRPNIQTNRDQAASEDSVLTVITRELVSELRRTVLENTHHDMHPEYVNAVSSSLNEEVQSEAPNLKLVGPSVVEDAFYRLHEQFDIETMTGFRVFTKPVTVRLDYQYVGVTRTKGEAFNLWNAITLFLNRKIFLDIAKDGADKANGVISFELNPTFETRGEFTTTTRQGFHQFTGGLHLRGVHAVAREVCPSKPVDECIVVTEKI